MKASTALVSGVRVFERGWLSANNILLTDEHTACLVDSGYVSHAQQTLSLVRSALGDRPLDLLVNTHLHSDHCGGNQTLANHYPHMQTVIPPGLGDAVQHWTADLLSYKATGQNCPAFRFQQFLQPGQTRRWANLDWDVLAAPGHDPHSVILHAPEASVLISADALWENGFGVVFPELEGQQGFSDVAATLDLIEQLSPTTIVPGHGRVFHDLKSALARARSRLESFAKSPHRHALHGAKVLLKFKMMELRAVSREDFQSWAKSVPLLKTVHASSADGSVFGEWIDQLLADLLHGGVVQESEGLLQDMAN